MLHSISVVIPTRNRWQLLPRAIASVLNQTFDVAEIIVVDDGSDDVSSKDSIEKMSPKVRVVRHISPQGAPCARNTGWRIAESDFIAFLDDDDVWLPQKLEKQSFLFTTHANQLDLVFCGEALVNDGRILRKLPAHWEDNSSLMMLERNVVGGTSTAMVRKECLVSQHGFDESLLACQDWDLWLRIALDGKVACVEEILVHRTIHGDQISSTLQKRIQGREAFLNKHRDEISAYPSMLAQHLRRIGCLHALAGKKNKAQDGFLSAIKVMPRSINSWVCLIVNSLLPQVLAVRVLSHYAVSRFGDMRIYH